MQTQLIASKRPSDLTDDVLIQQARTGDHIELLELRQRILEAIEQLPPRTRAVVLLRYFNQLSFREIGQALSIPESTAKTYFNRARKPLRTLLGPEFEKHRGRRNSAQCNTLKV